MFRPCVFGLLVLAVGERVDAAGPPVNFSREVQPILADACYHCHGPDEKQRKAKFRLDTKDGAFAASRDGKARIVPGSSGASELVRRLVATDASEHMPPARANRTVTPQQVETIRRWIDEGASWGTHWTYVAPRRSELPAVRTKGWARNPIDAFVLARLEKEGLAPAPEASRATLIRRVTLDLTGLPPTIGEVDDFLADPSAQAYEKVVDRLLRSPRYGERMALEWLDAGRYADSNGYQQDRTRTMWPWRDWLIGALNENKPFDQFTVEMLAGDLLPHATIGQQLATGFHRNHMLNGEGGRVAEESRVDYVVDRVDTTATVWLGATLGCARCHDHKYDPFTQKEYYRLFAYFNNLPESGGVDRGGNAVPVLRLPTPEQTAKLDVLGKSISNRERQLKAETDKHPLAPARVKQAALGALLHQPAAVVVLNLPDNPPAAAAVANAKKLLDDARKEREALDKAITEVMVMEERPQPRETFVLQRGVWDKPGEKVSPGVPAFLNPLPTGAPANRLGLARWLVDPANPLTARVAVNRAWGVFFGVGLIKTAEDFGVQGEPSTHPELLDWLAVDFREGGWDVKALHKRIVTSATYRQSSRLSPALRERDTDNRLLARGPRHRLSAHAIRDQALAVGGLLVDKIGGPPVKPYQPPGIWEDMSFGQVRYEQDKGDSLYRRSLYTFWRRATPPTTLFDIASRQVCTVRAARTNTPLHALTLLNDVTYVEAARGLAQRLLREGGATPEARIVHAFRLVTARKPSDAERQLLMQSVARLLTKYRADKDAALKLVGVGESPRDPKLDAVELAAYTGLAALVLNLDEAITKE